MASSSSSSLLSKLLFPLFITHIALSTSAVQAQVEETSLKLVRDALEWQLPMSFYNDLNDDEEADADIDGEGEGGNGYSRRSLFWKRMRLMALFILTLGAVPGSLVAGDDLLSLYPSGKWGQGLSVEVAKMS
ncbi:hypothetical protein V6N11_049153 [Hibiscus sabdariffa]|uniref:Uncharacterized protein n=2 Tax=Hibiscus sabdariffa TaxID=183260 RepID=A0ABR2PXC3_9ROSI